MRIRVKLVEGKVNGQSYGKVVLDGRLRQYITKVVQCHSLSQHSSSLITLMQPPPFLLVSGVLLAP